MALMSPTNPQMTRRAAPGSGRGLRTAPKVPLVTVAGHTRRMPSKPPAEGSKREEAGESAKVEAAEMAAGQEPAMSGGGTLTMARRRRIPLSSFGVPSKAPGSGSYPMNDKKHARLALSMDHNASPSERPAIEAKAHRMLGRQGAPGKRR